MEVAKPRQLLAPTKEAAQGTVAARGRTWLMMPKMGPAAIIRAAMPTACGPSDGGGRSE